MITWRLRTELIQPSPFRLMAIEPWAKEQSKATANNFCHSCLYKETESRINVNSRHIRHLHQALPGLVQAPLWGPALLWAQANFMQVPPASAPPSLYVVPLLSPAP